MTKYGTYCIVAPYTKLASMSGAEYSRISVTDPAAAATTRNEERTLEWIR